VTVVGIILVGRCEPVASNVLAASNKPAGVRASVVGVTRTGTIVPRCGFITLGRVETMRPN
jgi:hypothetical protein